MEAATPPASEQPTVGADRRRLWQHVFLGMFLTTMVYGIIDAYVFP